MMDKDDEKVPSWDPPSWLSLIPTGQTSSSRASSPLLENSGAKSLSGLRRTREIHDLELSEEHFMMRDPARCDIVPTT